MQNKTMRPVYWLFGLPFDAVTRDDALLLIMAHWTPDPAANCPVDQPISACELTPEQRLYTVTIQAATK